MPGSDAPRALANEAVEPVLGKHRLHHREHGLVERHVDDLAHARSPARWCTAESAPITPNIAASESPMEMPTRTGARSGITGDVAHAAHGFADRAEARAVLVRSGLPEARDAHHDEPGVVARQRVVAQVPLLQRARAGSSRRRCRRSRRACARSPGRRRSRRFTATDFLLRACAYHQSDVPSCRRRHLRSGSPSPGVSTFTTSAPNSASRRAQYGPAMSVPSSTTLRLESGPGMRDRLG